MYVISIFVMFSDSPPPGAPNTGLSTGAIAGIVVVVLVVVVLAVAVIIMGVVWWRRQSGEFSCGSLAVLGNFEVNKNCHSFGVLIILNIARQTTCK